ncbi:hypothetical protein [Mycolicibacterium pulveris]|uniref:hypothetical protein n=1 Tax=Mycolicibacterium pulveris TaxID=36813 RepID=UPI003CEB5C0D
MPTGTTTGYARYVGRVGALAVALGIGVAIASTPGIVGAAPDTEPSGTEVSDVGTGAALDSDASQNATPTPASESGSGRGDEPSEASTAEPDPRDGTVQATGGLNTTVNGDPDADTDGDVDTDTDGTITSDVTETVSPGDATAKSDNSESSDAVAAAFSDTRVQSLVMKYAGGVIRGGSEDPTTRPPKR